MELNPDCIRDILLVVEKNATFGQWIDTSAFEKSDIFSRYTADQVIYHIRQAQWAGLLQQVKWTMDGFIIQDLSPEGHEFLSNIRQDTNWNQTKKIAAKVGSFSVSTLTTIASGVISDLIKKNLHLS
ncbi:MULTISPECIES: DUF2513 domain-containing protein [Loigolactobacillus]|uniref:DUF2513 domain-containing protein n=1 Tax=Loigolactobacillus TaxID=2767889 RepID=UPI000F739DB3|nr:MULTISPECIES: DUF2513 domain-containing protein [Loigolactobacillus]MBW4803776.1 DUF2513 domain-containing protein [Loigolactobacillus coryniformis subsp. torquens]MBW4806478.1 DUF2513 domain-containing protein [Loigolactobacillus coryniformis subsp. torquens]MCL5458049.1 DUF2513 domain-containing protein [Loigolactobacillus coryniformis]